MNTFALGIDCVTRKRAAWTILEIRRRFAKEWVGCVEQAQVTVLRE
jgi:hypothetical protein